MHKTKRSALLGNNLTPASVLSRICRRHLKQRLRHCNVWRLQITYR